MTLSDTDLEARLRHDLRAIADAAPRAPRDLAELTRQRHRLLRRRKHGLAAAALAGALVLVGVPIVTATLGPTDVGRRRRQRVPRPRWPASTNGPRAVRWPTTARWLADVAALHGNPRPRPIDPGMTLPDPLPDTRHVAYADDVRTGRVALVVGLQGEDVVHAWFTGRVGADPAEMTLATYPYPYDSDVVALLDATGPEADELTLIVVADPGDDVARQLPSVVEADGSVVTGTEDVPLQDGVAVVGVDRSWAESYVMLEVTRREPAVDILLSQGVSARPSAVQAIPADPRGVAIRSGLAFPDLETEHLLRMYGLTPAQARPTLLAAGSLTGHASTTTELTGITFPSGATTMLLVTYAPQGPYTLEGTNLTIELPIEPAGTPLLDRVVALGLDGGLAVTAPDGVEAEVLDGDGAVLETLPLQNGGGIGPLARPERRTASGSATRTATSSPRPRSSRWTRSGLPGGTAGRRPPPARRPGPAGRCRPAGGRCRTRSPTTPAGRRRRRARGARSAARGGVAGAGPGLR